METFKKLRPEINRKIVNGKCYWPTESKNMTEFNCNVNVGKHLLTTEILQLGPQRLL